MVYGYRRLSATATLIVINVVLFLLVAFFSLLRATALEGWLALPSSIVQFIYQPWSILSYMFLHFNFWHLLVNMLWLLMCGRILSLTVSDKIVWSVYIWGGIGGGVLYLLSGLLLPGFASVLCGASASVIALMITAGLRSPNMEVNLMLLGPIRLKWIVGVAVLIMLFGGGGNIYAHIGGAIAGVLLYLYYFKPRRRKASPRKSKPQKVNRSMQQALKQRRMDNDRLNILIDKIRSSGYQSLSVKEQSELAELSNKLKAGPKEFSNK
jgi:membrane associated rhomboid family serine protease